MKTKPSRAAKPGRKGKETMKKQFKAIARMHSDEKQWEVIIGHYDKFIDAERDARRFAKKYDECLWVQVLEA